MSSMTIAPAPGKREKGDRSPSPQRFRSKSFEPQPQPLRLILQEMSTWLPQNKRHCDRRPEIYKRSSIGTCPRKLRSPQPQLPPSRKNLRSSRCRYPWKSAEADRRSRAQDFTRGTQQIAPKLLLNGCIPGAKRSPTNAPQNPPKPIEIRPELFGSS